MRSCEVGRGSSGFRLGTVGTGGGGSLAYLSTFWVLVVCLYLRDFSKRFRFVFVVGVAILEDRFKIKFSL